MSSMAQYPFEKFKSPKLQAVKFVSSEKNNLITLSKTVSNFFDDKSNLQIQLSTDAENATQTNIRIKTNRNKKNCKEEIILQNSEEFFVVDFNGDGKKDIKIVCSYNGNGLAALNVRVIYFFQIENNGFKKISFDDMMTENRLERDINNDGNFEIITMTLQNHKNHNYWFFNAFNFEKGSLKLVNKSVNFPQMYQYMNKENFVQTTKISEKEILKYQVKIPEALAIE